MSMKFTPDDMEFVRGICFAAAEVVRVYDEPSIAAQVLNLVGIRKRRDLKSIRALELEEYDLKELRKALG